MLSCVQYPAARHLQYDIFTFQDLQMPPQLPVPARGLTQEISLQMQSAIQALTTSSWTQRGEIQI